MTTNTQSILKMLPKFMAFANGPIPWKLACYGSAVTLILVWSVLILTIVNQLRSLLNS